MKLYRLMGIEEFIKMGSGMEMESEYGKFAEAKTDSEGYCFIGENVLLDDYDGNKKYISAKEAIINIFGIMGRFNGSVLVEFEVMDDSNIKEGYGEYIYAITDSMSRINEYSMLSYNKEKLIPRRYIPDYKNSCDWEWRDYSQNEFYTIRDYLNYQLRDGNPRGIDIKYLPALKNTSKNEYWDIDDKGETLRYINGITGETRYKMSICSEGFEYVLNKMDNVPDFWKDIYNAGIRIERNRGFKEYDFFIYASLIAEFPELKNEFELKSRERRLGIYSKSTGYDFYSIRNLELVQNANGEIDILGKAKNQQGEEKNLSILELARFHNNNNVQKEIRKKDENNFITSLKYDRSDEEER